MKSISVTIENIPDEQYEGFLKGREKMCRQIVGAYIDPADSITINFQKLVESVDGDEISSDLIASIYTAELITKTVEL